MTDTQIKTIEKLIKDLEEIDKQPYFYHTWTDKFPHPNGQEGVWLVKTPFGFIQYTIPAKSHWKKECYIGVTYVHQDYHTSQQFTVMVASLQFFIYYVYQPKPVGIFYTDMDKETVLKYFEEFKTKDPKSQSNQWFCAVRNQAIEEYFPKPATRKYFIIINEPFKKSLFCHHSADLDEHGDHLNCYDYWKEYNDLNDFLKRHKDDIAENFTDPIVDGLFTFDDQFIHIHDLYPDTLRSWLVKAKHDKITSNMKFDTKNAY